MNERDLAYNILDTALDVYETTGWCKEVLVHDKVVYDRGFVVDRPQEERCILGALTLGIITHCDGLMWFPLDNDYFNISEDYPLTLRTRTDNDVEKNAIDLVLRTVAETMTDEPVEYRFVQETIYNVNDAPSTTREDILLFLEKARANV